MSKSGQPATQADKGGQRVPKTKGDSTGSTRPAPRKDMPAKKEAGKKSGT